MELRTEIDVCVLRPWAATDKQDLVCFADNRAVWRNLLDSFPHPYTEADAESWIAHAEANPGLHFAIQVGGVAVGGISAITQTGHAIKTAHFGYWLAEHVWGKGFATAAAPIHGVACVCQLARVPAGSTRIRVESGVHARARKVWLLQRGRSSQQRLQGRRAH